MNLFYKTSFLVIHYNNNNTEQLIALNILKNEVKNILFKIKLCIKIAQKTERLYVKRNISMKS